MMSFGISDNEIDIVASDVEEHNLPILFVDDEESILRALVLLFGKMYDVHTAKSGAEAMLALDSFDPYAIVSDQRMPVMAGTEVLTQARNIRPYAVRVLMTGYTSASDIIKAVNDGHIYAFVGKPWDLETFTSQLRRWVAVSKIIREELRNA